MELGIPIPILQRLVLINAFSCIHKVFKFTSMGSNSSVFDSRSCMVTFLESRVVISTYFS